MHTSTLALLVAGIYASVVEAGVRTANPVSTEQFTNFFPSWQDMIQQYLVQNCSEPYDVYRRGVWVDPEGEKSQLVSPVIDCLLNVFPEHKKAEIGVSAVILGLLPTLLQYLGSTPVETALISVRRPFFSLLLAAGSPSVAPMKVGDFIESMDGFITSGDARPVLPGVGWMNNNNHPGRRPLWMSFTVYCIQFVLVAAAVVNIVTLLARLSYFSLAIIAPEEVFLVLLWGLMCVVIHIAAVAILHLRVRISSPREDGRKRSSFLATVWRETTRGFFKTSACQPNLALELRDKKNEDENINEQDGGILEGVAMYLTWLLCFGTVINLIYGTMIFGGLLFYSMIDSIIIVLRLISSSVICRLVVRMELHGLMRGHGRREKDATDSVTTYLIKS